jgi:hypothetical protein
MAYEVRGSMMVYLFLGITAAFTPTRRFLCLSGIVAYSMYTDKDVLSDLPFYTGAMLADLSLVLNDQTFTSLPLFNACNGLSPTGNSRWAIVFAFVALYLGSYPPNSYEYATWSQQLNDLGRIIFSRNCIPPQHIPVIALLNSYS